MYQPLVSIVIPVYNGVNYLREAIDSALAQTYKYIEIIVVNDGSTDNSETEKLALSYGEKIRYIRKENGGSSSALNVGIDNMKGDWFSWLSHDDLYYPNKIKRQIELLESLTSDKGEISLNKQVVVCESEIIGSNGRTLFKPNDKIIHNKLVKINSLSNAEIVIETLNKLSFNGCSFLLPKDCFKCIGKFDENLRLLNDIEYWLRLLINEYKFHYIPEVLVKGRMHKKQISYAIGFSYNNKEQTTYWNSIIDWIYSNKNTRKAEYFYRIGKYATVKGRNAEAKKAFQYSKSMSKKYSGSIPLIYAGIKIYRYLRNIAKKIFIRFQLR